MNSKKNLTLNGLILPNFIYVTLSIGMIFVGVYLTSHFFNTLYPQGLSASSTLCNINDFWACDKATHSPLATIIGMPTSVFAIIMGIIGLFTAFIASPQVEKTTKSILLINLLFCVLLLIYSLVSLKSLCPVCTVYYLLSAASFFLFYKFSDSTFGFDLKVSAGFLSITVIALVSFNLFIGGKKKDKTLLANSYVSQFEKLKDYGIPSTESPYKIHSSTSNFSDAPIKITIFSDFQCPFCQTVSQQLPAIIREFKGKINIQYMFYPLDSSCNSAMKGGMHVYACQAAYLAACDKEKFSEVHDYIFDHQSEINNKNLKIWAKKFQLGDKCFDNKNIQSQIQKTLNAGEQYNLKSTPTMIINGRKLEGMIPTTHLKSIIHSLLGKK